jgi:hypothetical protein
MKRISMLLAAGVAASVLSACGGTAAALTFPQAVSIACGGMKGELVILQSDGVFTGGAADTLTKKVQPAVDKVCAAGASVTKPDLQTLVNTTLPLVKTFVDASSLSPDKIKIADAAIDSGVLAFNIAISMAPAATATDAPNTASTPLAGAPLK